MEVDEEYSGKMHEVFKNYDESGSPRSDEAKESEGVQNQKEIWNHLLKARLLLQPLVVISMKMPQTGDFNKIKKGGKEIGEHLKEGIKCTTQLSETFLDLYDKLLDGREIGNINRKKSDTDEGKRKQDCSILAKHYGSLLPYRNSVLKFYDERTRLRAAKRLTEKSFNKFNHTALKEIEQILSNKSNLIRRTQLKRSFYQIIGKSKAIQDENSKFKTQDLLLKNYDTEIFDDDDFYHQMLKDFIESKSFFELDPAVIRKQMEIQRVRNKMKRKVDTKASKGRKLRYDIHPKMVNCMAPVKTCFATNKERESFLKSLFGGKNK